MVVRGCISQDPMKKEKALQILLVQEKFNQGACSMVREQTAEQRPT